MNERRAQAAMFLATDADPAKNAFGASEKAGMEMLRRRALANYKPNRR